ncbi:DUF3168 domain-containing protein [Rhodopseudomonas telluris]|uniref:DUF3168 domain-containing protein n=1 Tax=Rhodopseudomonas telluris TaxID=644215 RepID=A0ABV6EZL6_9BRAD
MSDPSYELQAALVAALKADAALSALIAGRIYDAVPTDAVFPYVSLGPCQVLPMRAGCIDGAEVYPQIDVWSRAVGFPECKRIAKALVAALDDQDLAVSDHHTVLFDHQSTNYLRDPDGKTSHAAILFHGSFTSL